MTNTRLSSSIRHERVTVRPRQTVTAIFTADITTDSSTIVGHEKTTMLYMPEGKVGQACMLPLSGQKLHMLGFSF